jgi:transcriptional regulator of arginine metabolism
MKLTKAQRQHKVAQLIEDHDVTSQAELVRLLAEQGVEATQVTVSRDLEELGALKVRRPGGVLVYALADGSGERPAAEAHLRRVLSEWAAEIKSSANLVVVRTPPGCAHVVASALDRARISQVAGTVAGDDTVLVVASEGTKGSALARRLAAMAGQAGTKKGES